MKLSAAQTTALRTATGDGHVTARANTAASLERLGLARMVERPNGHLYPSNYRPVLTDEGRARRDSLLAADAIERAAQQDAAELDATAAEVTEEGRQEGARLPTQGPAAPPVAVRVDWTARDGESLTGIMSFSLTAAEDAALTAAGREPQFLLTGGTRRKTVRAFNAYSTTHFHETAPLDEVVRRAAAWLGLEGRTLVTEVVHEYRA